jgi:hypothetical protein
MLEFMQHDGLSIAPVAMLCQMEVYLRQQTSV